MREQNTIKPSKPHITAVSSSSFAVFNDILCCHDRHGGHDLDQELLTFAGHAVV
jgi:hypothetical protein